MFNQLLSFIQKIFSTAGFLVLAVLNMVETITVTFFRVLNSLIDMISFVSKSEFVHNNFRFIMIFTVIGLHHNFIIINEEILVTFCFLAALFFLNSNLGDSVTEALNERSEGIRKELSTFLLLKQENLIELHKSEEGFLETVSNLSSLQVYCQEHFAHLDQNQQKALVGIVAQNLHAKLDALEVVTKSLQPALHSQMNASFREAILEDFTKGNKLQLIKECLSQIQTLPAKAK